MGLRNRTIVITRPVEQSGEMIAAIERAGGKALSYPMIRIAEPPSWEACDDALRRLDAFDGVVFTSANAARAFCGRCVFSGTPLPETVWAAGAKTKEAAEGSGCRVCPLPEKYSAADLARHMGAGEAAGKKFLFAKGDIAGDVLPRMLREAGAEVQEVVVYATLPPAISDNEDLLAKLLAGSVDAVTFASPSSVRNFAGAFPVPLLGEIARHTVFAAIGPTTAGALRSLNLEVSVVASAAAVAPFITALEGFFHDQ